MRAESNVAVRAGKFVLLGAFFVCLPAAAQVVTPTNVTIRVMASNLSSGNSQRYEPPGLNILKGLKPDIVCLQEFNCTNQFGVNTAQSISNMVATTFGTNFVYFRETGYNIPNGIVSRYAITNSGSWTSDVGDRGYAWAQINLPGTNDLYVVSVHLKASSGSSSQRAMEATNLTELIQSNFPANAWIIVAGDFNIGSSGEAALAKFKTYLSDSPIPTDSVTGGDADTSEPRSERYDYVLPSFSLTNSLTPVVLPSHTFNNGLVFDSNVYTPLSDVSPVLSTDSHTNGMQHMGVVKDFRITYYVTNGSAIAPVITNQPQSLTVTQGNNAAFSVIAGGTAPLSYQWRFTTTNIAGATTNTYTRSNAQPAHAGDYTVVITNAAGSITSSPATLTVLVPPSITSQTSNQTVIQGSNATFNVVAAGTGTLGYQWRFSSTNISGATASAYTRSNAQPAHAGDYSVVITNHAGSITSSPATLTVLIPPSVTSQPTNQTVIQGNNATFIVVGSGTGPLSYQWRFATTNIAGATTSTYTRTNAQPNHAGDYSVIITNAAGSVTSSNATLTVIVPPGITTPPQDQSVSQAADATFTVTASGSPTLAYQWRFNSVNIGGANSSSYTRSNAQPADLGNYSVIVTNAGGSITSAAAALSLLIPAPTLTILATDTLSWPGLSNLNYTVQAKTNVDDTNWNTIGTASSPTTTISFTNSSLDAPQRFYRVVYP